MPRKEEWYICFISLIIIWNLSVTFTFFMSNILILILTCTGHPVCRLHTKMLRSCARCQYEDQYKTLDNQTENILPVSLTMSLSIQLMTTFKPSSGFRNTIKSCRNLFYAQLHALSLSVHAQRSAVHKQRINQCMIDLHWFNTRELKMDMFWICLKS